MDRLLAGLGRYFRTFFGLWWVRLIFGLLVILIVSEAARGAGDGLTDGLIDRDAPRAHSNISMLGAVFAALASLGAYWAFFKVFERRPADDLALRRGPVGNGPVELFVGCAVALGLMALVTTVLALAGSYTITAVNPVSAILPALAIGIYAGVVEEILLRGLVFRLAEEWMGSVGALVLSSLLFGFLHGLNPSATLFSSVAIALEAGVLLGLAYMFTRRLWLVIGIHLAWNTTLGGLFGMPVSGYALPSILEATVEGPDLLTGGEFGPEASLTAIVICGLAAAAFAWGITKRGDWRRASWRS